MNVLSGVEIGLYGVLLVALMVSVGVSFKEADVARFRTQQWFHLFLASFVIVRLLWFGLRSADASSNVTFVLNRVGFSLYFTAFTLVLFFWVENYHKTYIDTTEFLPRFFWAFILCNIVMYLFETIIVILFLTVSRGKEEGDPIYDLSIYTIIALSFAVSALFFVYGIRLYVRQRVAKDFEGDREHSSELIKIFLCTFLFCACFVIRGCAFLYRPITNKHLNSELFMSLGYFIPELIPSFVEFYVIRTLKRQSREQTTFIETLYQEEEHLQREEGHTTPPLALDDIAKASSPRLSSYSSSSSLLSSSSSLVSGETAGNPTKPNEMSPLMGPSRTPR